MSLNRYTNSGNTVVE